MGRHEVNASLVARDVFPVAHSYTHRRIERLLIASHPTPESATIEPRVTGLLLLATTQLRHYAEKHLPLTSRIREGFLEDVAGLEDSTFGREEKLRIVDRMWRSWGNVLGWERIGDS